MWLEPVPGQRGLHAHLTTSLPGLLYRVGAIAWMRLQPNDRWLSKLATKTIDLYQSWILIHIGMHRIAYGPGLQVLSPNDKGPE